MTVKWLSGPPPFVGWWNASSGRNPVIWRWWNGKHWSCGVNCTTIDAEQAEFEARYPASDRPEVYEWTWRWPKNARVPRIDPRK